MLRMMTIWNSQWYALCLHDCTCSHSCNILLPKQDRILSVYCFTPVKCVRLPPVITISCTCVTLMFLYFIASPQRAALLTWSVAIFWHLSMCESLLPSVLERKCTKVDIDMCSFGGGWDWKSFFFLGINMTSWNFHKPGYIWNDWCTLPISQTSTSACCLEYVKTLNVSTPKEATGAHVNQAIC